MQNYILIVKHHSRHLNLLLTMTSKIICLKIISLNQVIITVLFFLYIGALDCWGNGCQAIYSGFLRGKLKSSFLKGMHYHCELFILGYIFIWQTFSPIWQTFSLILCLWLLIRVVLYRWQFITHLFFKNINK